MKLFITIITSVVGSLVAVVAAPEEQTSQNPPPLDANSRDSSVKPGDDFFLFANGAWIKQTEIPPEYSRWGAFNELIERNNDALHTIAGEGLANTGRSEACAGDAESRRLLRERDGREGDRSGANTTPLTEEFAENRRDERSAGCAQGDRASAQHRASTRSSILARARTQGQHSRHRAGGAGRPRHAGSRLLHQAGRRYRKRSARSTSRT